MSDYILDTALVARQLTFLLATIKVHLIWRVKFFYMSLFG